MSLSGLTVESYILGGVMSFAAYQIGNFIEKKDQSTRGTAIAFAILGMGAFAGPALSKNLFAWTGSVITQSQSLLLFGVAASIKAAWLACKHFIFINSVSGPEEALELYNLQLRPLNTHFTKQPESFYAMDLRTQVILNKRFSENDLTPVPLKEFSEVGTGYTQEELEYFSSAINLDLFSKEDRQKLVLFQYENSKIWTLSLTSEDLGLIPVKALTRDQIERLSPEQIRWTWLTAKTHDCVPELADAWQALSRAFFDAKLDAPNQRYLLAEPTYPKSLDAIQQDEVYLVSWLNSYYAAIPQKWFALPYETQVKLNLLFPVKQMLFSTDETFDLNETLVKTLHHNFNQKRAFWHLIPLTAQNRLNEEFKKLNLTPFKLIDKASAEEVNLVIQFINNYPFFFEEMSPKHQKLIYNRCGHDLHRLSHPTLSPLFNKLGDEENARQAKNAAIATGMFVVAMTITSIVCFNLSPHNPYDMDRIGYTPHASTHADRFRTERLMSDITLALPYLGHFPWLAALSGLSLSLAKFL